MSDYFARQKRRAWSLRTLHQLCGKTASVIFQFDSKYRDKFATLVSKQHLDTILELLGIIFQLLSNFLHFLAMQSTKGDLGGLMVKGVTSSRNHRLAALTQFESRPRTG